MRIFHDLYHVNIQVNKIYLLIIQLSIHFVLFSEPTNQLHSWMSIITLLVLNILWNGVINSIYSYLSIIQNVSMQSFT